MDRVKQLRVLIEENPGEVFPKYGLAVEYKNRKDYEQSIQVFESLLKQHPDYVPAYFQYGMSLVAEGLEQKAMKVFQQGIELAAQKGEKHAQAELESALSELCGRN